jgi:peptidoglycan/xylan/chitin deacetylase (PgdA/CDA1 family)
LIDAGQPIYCGAGTKPLVALTFDDGPGPDTVQTIEALKAAGMTATFFEVGKLLGEPMFDGIPKAAARFGAIGDHTWDHISMLGLSATELDAEIGRTRRILQQLTGQRVFMFRPPLGQRNATVDTYVRSAGMLQIMWTIDSGDSMGASDDQIYRTIRAHLSPGDIVLLHENRGTTQNALPRIIRLIQRKGYRTVTVPQLLTMDPPSPEQLRHHTCG